MSETVTMQGRSLSRSSRGGGSIPSLRSSSLVHRSSNFGTSGGRQPLKPRNTNADNIGGAPSHPSAPEMIKPATSRSRTSRPSRSSYADNAVTNEPVGTDNTRRNNAPPSKRSGGSLKEGGLKEGKSQVRPKAQQPASVMRSGTAASQSDSESYMIEEIRRSSDGSTSTHRYLRGKLIGKGGFAKVYSCTSLDTQKLYAIKIVPKANLVKARARQKLQAEIKIHRTLKHKRICDFKHFFEDRTNCYILLELCPSQTLNEMIKRRKRLTEPEVRYYMAQIVDGTQYLHATNVIHRDLKLGNLFLDKNLGLKIGDFGLAVQLENSGDKRSTICGTPNYIAPEVIDGKKRNGGHSFEVDIWAMGVIMYAIMIGKPPYEAKDVKSTYQRILNNEYHFPDHIPISKAAKGLITGMLQTKPEDRPSLAEVANDPFFTDPSAKIPESLPTMSTHVAPIWRADEFGELVAEVAKPKSSSTSIFSSFKGKSLEKKSAPQSSSESHRRPLAARDNNINQCPDPQQMLQAPAHDAKPYHKKEPISAARRNPLNALKTAPKKLEKPAMDGTTTTLTTKAGKQYSQLKFSIYNDGENGDGNMSVDLDKQCEGREQPEYSEPSKFSQKRRVSTAPPGPPSCPPPSDVVELTSKTSELSVNARRPTSTMSSITSVSKTTTAQWEPFENDKDGFVECNGGGAGADREMLDSIHQRLQSSFSRDNTKDGIVGNRFSHSVIPAEDKLAKEATTWVTRYVDYTSKYGLGFLLNDGSAGVYFNDSTKAVLSPDGDRFQYVERRKIVEPSTDGAPKQRQDPVCKIYSIHSHPEPLQKKVTLLNHFRNYLLEQQQKSDQEPGESGLLEGKIKEAHGSIQQNRNNDIEDGELVYLKKWVRTRHAILFRLSNRTVQVVFYDHSEILLYCEARVVTYVDKQQKRSTHHIDDVTKNPNCEIAKRLKYSMDILHQLLSSGSKR